MMGDRTKAWLIAMLSAESAITSLFTKGSKSVLAAGQSYPSDEGVYVHIISELPAEFRGFNKTTVRIYGVRVGEQQCYDVLSAVFDTVYKPPGSPGVWGVLPSTVSLVVKATTEPVMTIAPEKIGDDNSYSGVLQFEVIGRDRNRPL